MAAGYPGLSVGAYDDLMLEKKIGTADWTRIVRANGELTILLDIPAELIAGVLSLYGIALTAAKLLCGEVIDRIGVFVSNMFFYSILICGLILFALSGKGVPFLYAGAMMLAAGNAVGSVGMAAFSEGVSTEKTYEKNVRRIQTFYTMGGVTGSFIPGLTADLTGDYVLIYLLWGMACAVVFPILQMLYRQLRNFRS